MELPGQISEVKERIKYLEGRILLGSGLDIFSLDERLEKKKEEFESLTKDQRILFDRFHFKVKASRKL